MKQHIAVRRVIDTLRRNTRLRQFITLRSERNLRRLAVMDPNRAKPLLKGLLALERLAVPIDKLTVPTALRERQNKAVLESLASLGVLFKAIDAEGRLDLRRAGVKLVPGYINLLPNLINPSLEAELNIVRNPEARAEIARDKVLTNLVLFRALMAARIEIYELGEAKSAAKRSKDKSSYERASAEMRAYARLLEEFNEQFPFDNIDNRQKVRDDIAGAVKWLEKLNNPVADNILLTLSRRVMNDLERAEAVRFRHAISKQSRRGLQVARGKVRIVDSLRGNCIITSSGYKNTAAGILSKTMIDYNVSTRKILSMIDHEIARAQTEKTKNAALIHGLMIISRNPLERFDKLYEANVILAQVRDLGKRKAVAELSGARRLLAIPQEQAQRLAGQLIEMAAQDLERRNVVLDAQIARLTQLKAQTEELLGDVVKGLAYRWASYFAKPDRDLRSLRRLDQIQKSLGKYLGTLLGPKKEDLREHWMRQARSHITGVLRQMSGIARPLRELNRLRIDRGQMLRVGGNSAQQKFDLRVLDGEIENLEKQTDDLLLGVNFKAARLILRIEFDFINRGKTWKRGERQAALRVFYRSKVDLYGPGIAL